MRAERLARAHWSAYAGLSAVTWVLLALHLGSPPLVAVLIGVCSAISLRRGIRLFIGRPLPGPAPNLSFHPS